MRVFELSPRLRSVADWVPPNARFIDVGTDHAYLPVWLILRGVIDYAVASDLSEGPLDRAKQTAGHYNVAERISFRLCDGLAGVTPGEADTIAIAGMGGETIAAILAAAPWTTQDTCRLILQPMSAHEDLRSWLYGHGYYIDREALTQEGKTLYSTFLVFPGEKKPLTPAETWAGRQQEGMKDPLRSSYLERLLRRANSALEGICHSAKPEDAARKGELEEVRRGLQEMKEEWDAWQR